MSVEDSVKHLKSDLKVGLTSAEAAKRLEEHGPNELDGEEDKSLWERIAEQFEDELVIILLVAAVISFIIAITGKLTSFRANYKVPLCHHVIVTDLLIRMTRQSRSF
jgi:magnesium-transporting ATPase (P-type)